MKKNFFNKEVKIGLMVFVAIFLLYFGLNFLKGIDIFTSTRSYYTTYENLDGLVASSPVFIKGYKVGQVDEIQYDFSKEKPFLVKITIEKKNQSSQKHQDSIIRQRFDGRKSHSVDFCALRFFSKFLQQRRYTPIGNQTRTHGRLEFQFVTKN